MPDADELSGTEDMHLDASAMEERAHCVTLASSIV